MAQYSIALLRLFSNFCEREIFFSVFCFLIPFSAFTADGEFSFIDRFVSFNPVRKVAQVYIQRVHIRDVQQQAFVIFNRREQLVISMWGH